MRADTRDLEPVENGSQERAIVDDVTLQSENEPLRAPEARAGKSGYAAHIRR